MMNLQQAVAYGKSIGVRYYVYNEHGCLMGGAQTRKEAEAMKKRFEIEDEGKPWARGTTRYCIKPAR